ncbi:hypothetical protein EDD29_8263 [Actinocorallia herbida]|uniref:Alpha/beta hydrolase family protein n=1 Tax=Actinocorallia herbida TaxID=58109 RepID=A0A3N1DAH1_9ACTN|nr:hypothetical protein [Actinocorallia herbida]ROO90532.1 hypothetical protein EDD29_8263 [Actinocorallia herbida]
MTPGTLVLLGAPLPGGLADELRTQGLHVVVPQPTDDPATGARYIAGSSLAIAAAAPEAPLVLVGHGCAGPLLPSLAGAQKAAHRLVGGYVFLDADLPAHGGDWPDAPCAFLATSPDDVRLKAARARAWETAHTAPENLSETLSKLIAQL